MPAAKNTFSKKHRLKSRKQLQQVFSAGQRIYSGPVKLLYITTPNDAPVLQCGVGTSIRNFKKAVDRNRVKRLLREAYRLQQHHLQQLIIEQKISISVFILYVGKELPTYDALYQQTGTALHLLAKKINAAHIKNT